MANTKRKSSSATLLDEKYQETNVLCAHASTHRRHFCDFKNYTIDKPHVPRTHMPRQNNSRGFPPVISVSSILLAVIWLSESVFCPWQILREDIRLELTLFAFLFPTHKDRKPKKCTQMPQKHTGAEIQYKVSKFLFYKLHTHTCTCIHTAL